MAHRRHTGLTAAEWLYLALAGYVSKLAGTAFHEVLGHGGTALLLGGEFHDVFVTPLDGQAGASAAGAGNAVVLAAGSLVEITLGVAAWLWLRGRLATGYSQETSLDHLSLLLWLFAAQAVLSSVIYMTVVPAVQAAFGATSGDWPLLLANRPVVRAAMLIIGAACLVPIAVALLRDALKLAPVAFVHHTDSFTKNEPASSIFRTSLRAWGYWCALLLPSILLCVLYAVSLAPWLDGSLPIILGSVTELVWVGLPAAFWLGRAHSHRSGTVVPAMSRIANRGSADAAHSWTWIAIFAASAAAIALVFGPTHQLRRGLAISPPSGDQYISAAQFLTIELDLTDRARPVATLVSEPRHGAGSRYRQKLTEALALRGPSKQAARELSEFIARWNLGNAEVGTVSTPRLDGNAWTWQFDLLRVPSPIQLAFWPMTWVRESHVREVRILGAVSAGGAHELQPESVDPDVLVWFRPPDMKGVRRFAVEWR